MDLFVVVKDPFEVVFSEVFLDSKAFEHLASTKISPLTIERALELILAPESFM